MLELKRLMDLQLFGDDDGVGTDTGSDDKGEDKDPTLDDDKSKAEDAGDKGGRTYAQEEVEALIRDRIKRERKMWAQKFEDEKKKAAMSEAERLKAEKEEAEKNAAAAVERANLRLIRSEVVSQAAKLNIVDPDAAYMLMDKTDVKVEDDDTVVGVKEALQALIKSKPYLTGSKQAQKTGDDQGDDKGSKGGFSMNDLIRKAAGR